MVNFLANYVFVMKLWDISILSIFSAGGKNKKPTRYS